MEQSDSRSTERLATPGRLSNVASVIRARDAGAITEVAAEVGLAPQDVEALLQYRLGEGEAVLEVADPRREEAAIRLTVRALSAVSRNLESHRERVDLHLRSLRDRAAMASRFEVIAQSVAVVTSSALVSNAIASANGTWLASWLEALLAIVTLLGALLPLLVKATLDGKLQGSAPLKQRIDQAHALREDIAVLGGRTTAAMHALKLYRIYLGTSDPLRGGDDPIAQANKIIFDGEVACARPLP